jgi:hypothetical protein
VNVGIVPTHPVANGMHSAVVRATNPGPNPGPNRGHPARPGRQTRAAASKPAARLPRPPPIPASPSRRPGPRRAAAAGTEEPAEEPSLRVPARGARVSRCRRIRRAARVREPRSRRARERPGR